MDLILHIIFAIPPVDWLCYRVSDSSILQTLFSSISKFLSYYEEKTLKRTNLNNILNISKLSVMRLFQNKKNQ